MKAIIMERRGEYAALLREDGVFVRERVDGAVGETVELTAKAAALPRRRSAWLRGAVAAALALSVTGGTLGYMGGTASAYVSLDVDEDSSIELTINHFGRVIAVNALDEDTRELAESVSGEVRRRSAENAINITVERLRERGCFDGQDGALIVGVATDSERRSAELREIVERTVERGGERTAYVAETSRAERAQAMEQKVSAGRFGYERDHREHDARTEGNEGRNKPAPAVTEASERPEPPAVPAQGAETEVPAGTPQRPPQPTREQPAQESGDPVREQPAQESGDPVREQPAQESGDPAREQPAQESGNPAREQPAQEGGQLPQDSVQPMPEPGGQPELRRP